MATDLLHALAADTTRLLGAGGPTAAGDERLRQCAAALRPLGERVPALKTLAEATDRVIGAAPDGAATPLLDLLTLVRQARAAVAPTGLAGELAPPEPAGPWATRASTREIFALIDLTPTGFAWRGRLDQLRDLAGTGTGADLRLLDAWLLLLEKQATGAGAVAVHEILLAYGPSVLAEVRHVRERDVSVVLLAYRLDRPTGVAWADDYLKQAADVAPLVAQFGPAGVRAWLEALDRRLREDGELSASDAAADALREIGRPAAARLMELLNDPRPSVRRSAVAALGGMGPTAKAALPALVELLRSDDSSLREAAFTALGQLGSAAEPALPALQEIARDFRDRLWQEKALEAIQQIRNALLAD